MYTFLKIIFILDDKFFYVLNYSRLLAAGDFFLPFPLILNHSLEIFCSQWLNTEQVYIYIDWWIHFHLSQSSFLLFFFYRKISSAFVRGVCVGAIGFMRRKGLFYDFRKILENFPKCDNLFLVAKKKKVTKFQTWQTIPCLW